MQRSFQSIIKLPDTQTIELTTSSFINVIDECYTFNMNWSYKKLFECMHMFMTTVETIDGSHWWQMGVTSIRRLCCSTMSNPETPPSLQCPLGQSMLSAHIMYTYSPQELWIERGTFASHSSVLTIGLLGRTKLDR